MEAVFARKYDYSGLHHVLYALSENKGDVTRELFNTATSVSSPWKNLAQNLLVDDSVADSPELAAALVKLLQHDETSYLQVIEAGQ